MAIQMKRKKAFQHKNLRIEAETLNKFRPAALDIFIKGWANISDKPIWNIGRINKKLKTIIYKNIDEDIFQKDRTIVIVDYPDSLKPDKQFYLSILITVFQKNSNIQDFLSDTIQTNLQHISNLCTDYLESNDVIELQKTKGI